MPVVCACVLVSLCACVLVSLCACVLVSLCACVLVSVRVLVLVCGACVRAYVRARAFVKVSFSFFVSVFDE